MKLAQYLPNFRHEVTVKDLEVLAEELDFDSIWTLARIVVPEASDRGEREHSFDMMKEFPKQLPVSACGQWYQGCAGHIRSAAVNGLRWALGSSPWWHLALVRSWVPAAPGLFKQPLPPEERQVLGGAEES